MINRKQLESQYNYLCKQTNTKPLPRKVLFTDKFLIMEINQILNKHNCLTIFVEEIEDMLK